ncbi:uncharacterized protein TNCV_3958941 [Trichonephila clavipes]|nr:uncharacterized protein TNCV_3958941 [Trichonephila clavipes]
MDLKAQESVPGQYNVRLSYTASRLRCGTVNAQLFKDKALEAYVKLFWPNPVSQKAYDRIKAKIADISEALANASMKKAAAEEKIIDRTVNSVVVNSDGTPGRPVGILHLLEKNHSRSAGKMEVCGMQKTFLRSEQKHGLKYQRYIGDGDSKTFLSIAEKEPYGDSVPIVKIECGGHV